MISQIVWQGFSAVIIWLRSDPYLMIIVSASTYKWRLENKYSGHAFSSVVGLHSEEDA